VDFRSGGHDLQYVVQVCFRLRILFCCEEHFPPLEQCVSVLRILLQGVFQHLACIGRAVQGPVRGDELGAGGTVCRVFLNEPFKFADRLVGTAFLEEKNPVDGVVAVVSNQVLEALFGLQPSSPW
jgi:hypothetical protein